MGTYTYLLEVLPNRQPDSQSDKDDSYSLQDQRTYDDIVRLFPEQVFMEEVEYFDIPALLTKRRLKPDEWEWCSLDHRYLTVIRKGAETKYDESGTLLNPEVERRFRVASVPTRKQLEPKIRAKSVGWFAKGAAQAFDPVLQGTAIYATKKDIKRLAALFTKTSGYKKEILAKFVEGRHLLYISY